MIEHCERCGVKLDARKARWLELNVKTGIYTDPEVDGDLPEDDSQGCFPFGVLCAKLILEEQKKSAIPQQPERA